MRCFWSLWAISNVFNWEYDASWRISFFHLADVQCEYKISNEVYLNITTSLVHRLIFFITLLRRDPRFFFVSTTSSTSVTTTTSLQSATFSCLILSKTAYQMACSGRRRRSVISRSLNTEDELLQISASRASRYVCSCEATL